MRKLEKCPDTVVQFVKCAIVFCLSVFLAMASLLTAAFAPQSYINHNLLESIDGLYIEGLYPVMGDRKANTMLDSVTDTMILRASAGMNRYYIGSILTNPTNNYNVDLGDPQDDLVKCLELYASGYQPDDPGLYPRYWMGFRAIMRCLLVFFDYFQIRRYVGALFFALFALVICSVSKRVDAKTAFAFALSIILVRPHVIANSLQFVCCFMIAFVAMLMTPLLTNRHKWDAVFFMEIGVVTMFFDFYTVPLVAVGFPLIYLAILRTRQGQRVTLWWLLRCVLIWLCGYALMWLAKLVLTNLLTSVDAISNGLSSFFGRVGITKTEGLEAYYDVSLAFEKIRQMIFCDKAGKAVYLTGGALVVISAVVSGIRKKLELRTLTSNGCLLFAAVLPLIWFYVTAQPIVIHFWFQYRSIALTHWAVGAYLTQTFWPSGKSTQSLAEGK